MSEDPGLGNGIEYLDGWTLLSEDSATVGLGRRTTRMLAVTGSTIVVGLLALLLAQPTDLSLSTDEGSDPLFIGEIEFDSDRSPSAPEVRHLGQPPLLNYFEERVEPSLLAARRESQAVPRRTTCCHDG